MKQEDAMHTVPAQVLRRAMSIVGNEQQLASALDVSMAQLSQWLNSVQTPPRETLLKAAAIMIGAGGRQ